MIHEVLKYKWALIGTIVLHIGLMIGFGQFRFKSQYEPLNLEEIPVLLEPAPIKELTPQEMEALRQQQNGPVSNQTVNERDQVGQTNQRYDSRKINESVDQDLHNLDQQLRDEARRKSGGENTNVAPPVHEHKDNTHKKEDNNTANNSNSSNTRNSAARVAGSYDLGGRRDESFVKPSYICKGSGNIILDIEVDRNGRVKTAVVNNTRSSYTEECMVENARKYALRCKFEAGTQYPNPQKGTITYTFIAQ